MAKHNKKIIQKNTFGVKRIQKTFHLNITAKGKCLLVRKVNEVNDSKMVHLRNGLHNIVLSIKDDELKIISKNEAQVASKSSINSRVLGSTAQKDFNQDQILIKSKESRELRSTAKKESNQDQIMIEGKASRKKTESKKVIQCVRRTIVRKKLKPQSYTIRKNDIVMAKMRSYCAWPARVTCTKEKRTEVFFFGTNQTGTVDTANIVPFCDSHETIQFLLSRRDPTFWKAVKEVETIMKIPASQSIINKIGDKL